VNKLQVFDDFVFMPHKEVWNIGNMKFLTGFGSGFELMQIIAKF
jgi:hypothetical protein